MEEKVNAKKKAQDPKPRLWPFGYDDAACKDADNAGEEEKPPRISPQHGGKHNPQHSRNKPDNAENKRELECRRQGIC